MGKGPFCDRSRLLDGIHLPSSTPRMLRGDPHLIHKGVGAEFEVARRLHLLRGLTLSAAEHLMPVLILERPVDRTGTSCQR
jgi:hypothetical protein